MTREQFIDLMKHPDVLNLTSVNQLEEITSQFPYFQNAHLLLAKQYHGHQNIKYDSYIQKAAAYAPDREVLYELISEPVSKEIHMDNNVVEHKTDTPVEEVMDVNETSSESSPEEVLKDRILELENKSTKEPEPINEIVESETDHIADTNVEEESSSLQADEKTVEPEAVTSELPPAQSTEEAKISDDTSKHSFTEWLKIRSVPVIPMEQVGERYAELPDEPAESENDKDGKQENIIDKFIASDPRIVPSKAEFYSAVNMARKSVESRDDMVSETLAKIYAEQGNHTKAIDTYKALSLKYPQKSSYFAALIKDLEDKD